MKKRADGRYQVSVVDPGGKRRFFYGKTKKEALRKLNDHISGRDLKKVPFNELAYEWYESHEPDLSPTTAKSYRSIIERSVDRFGSRNVFEISAKDISDHINGLGLSRKTAGNHLSVLKMIFKHAAVTCDLQRDPCANVRIIAGKRSEKRRALTREEIQTIKDNTDIPGGLFRFLLLCTGLRRGEALRLKYKDIDRKNKRIHVTKSAYYTSNKAQLKDPKTQSGSRDVVLLPDLEAVLPKGNKDRYIFSRDGSEPLTNKQARTLWDNYIKRTGLNVTPHYLRHTYATILFMSGIDVKTAQYLLGHSDIQTTMNIYTHMHETVLDRAIDKIKF